MTESSLLSTDVGAAVSLREMAYSWEDNPMDADRIRALEALVARALHLANGLQRAWSLASEDDKVWESGGYLRRMQAIDFLAVVVVDILAQTREIITSTRAKHPDWAEPPEASEMDSRLEIAKGQAAKVREILTWMNRPRPLVNEEMLRRSQEALSRGEGEDVGEIIARLQSGGPLVKE